VDNALLSSRARTAPENLTFYSNRPVILPVANAQLWLEVHCPATKIEGREEICYYITQHSHIIIAIIKMI
jgi:hypothetical protein